MHVEPEFIDYFLGFKPTQGPIHGLELSDVLNPTSLPDEQTHAPGEKNGAVLEMFFVRENQMYQSADEMFYGCFVTENIDTFQSGNWKLPSKKYINNLSSDNWRRNLFYEKARKSKKHKE